ncbi:MAG: hypothetical protein E4H27_02745 [Anaerolineales bacterium]|nr:MAG: hypothetical protein E4H27_02745 [Anaerolineales bacterium]
MILSSLVIVFMRRFVVLLVALGISSVALAIIFAILGAAYASSFELSVGVGLVSVLLIIATSLTRGGRVKDDQA